ncbi:hypothetical protein HJFPF1_01840 [Paramyrothecium foliicola]|nr:hypothetical protein HJFPF1_01840 [Paramyrothecium foliicola]
MGEIAAVSQLRVVTLLGLSEVIWYADEGTILLSHEGSLVAGARVRHNGIILARKSKDQEERPRWRNTTAVSAEIVPRREMMLLGGYQQGRKVSPFFLPRWCVSGNGESVFVP